MRDLYSLEQETPIELFELTNFNRLNMAETIRFCNYTDVVFEGNQYLALACEAKGFDVTTQGTNPMPTITISNAGRFIGSWIRVCETNSNYFLEGARVIRRMTQKKFLDGQEFEDDPIREYAQHVYRIEQVTDITPEFANFKLSNPWELEGVTLPRRIVHRDCSWTFRGPRCGYAGTVMRDVNGNVTTDPTKFDCGKTAANCAQYFGSNAILPFGGFVNLGAFGGIN
jgi:lambda family phage minor tail protein L